MLEIVGLEPEQHLVQHDVVEKLEARQRRELVREAPRVRARPLDELGHALPSERPQCRVDRKAAGAARELRRPVHLVAHGVGSRQACLVPVREGMAVETQLGKREAGR